MYIPTTSLRNAEKCLLLLLIIHLYVYTLTNIGIKHLSIMMTWECYFYHMLSVASCFLNHKVHRMLQHWMFEALILHVILSFPTFGMYFACRSSSVVLSLQKFGLINFEIVTWAPNFSMFLQDFSFDLSTEIVPVDSSVATSIKCLYCLSSGDTYGSKYKSG
jgi:hypothetical protein